MERINVNSLSAKDGCYSTTEESNKDQFEQGQVVEGVITKVSDTISITLNGKELQVSQSAVQNAKEGQVRTFEITDISKQSIVLREVGNDTEELPSQGVKQTSVVTGTAAFVGKLKDSKQNESLESAKDKVKQQITSTLARFSEADYAAMDKDATPIEEYNEDRFERMLDRVKEQRQFKRDHLENEIEKKQDNREQAEEASKDIKERLKEEELPATEANVAKVAGAMELAAMSAQMTDASKAYIIENNLPVTPENIYKSIYSGTGSVNQVADQTWEQLQPQVKELLMKDGLEASEQTLNDAKWLLSNDLPISGENIATLEQLNEIQKEMDPDRIMELCIKNLSEGKEPKETNLPEQMENLNVLQKAMDSVAMLQEITDESLDRLEEDDNVTIETLYQASKTSEPVTADGIRSITAKRQLEEVRLKLTMESSYQLYKQGIDVNTTELSKLVDELRALEDAYYNDLCKEYDVTASSGQAAAVKAADQMVNGLKGMPASILGSTFDARTSITMAELYAEGEEALKTNVNKSSEYETLMTAPRKDLGDSIKKAFANVDTILEDLALEPTESNERAVRILGYNQMEITKESITDMKSYDLQMNQLLNNLTPEVALTLIKEGKNPIDVPVSELNELVNEITDSLGQTSEEKFSEYLYNLDKRNGITPEERESYIGIYRLLHQVEKSDGAAVGAVVKAEQQLTLGNLLTAVRSKNNSGMDVEIGETFGGVESLKREGTSITDQVASAFYEKQVASESFKGLSVEAVEAAGSSKDNVWDISLEELYETEKNLEETSSDYTAKKYDTMMKTLKESKQSDLLVSAGIPTSVNNLEAAEYLLSEASSFFKDVKEKAEEISTDLGKEITSLYEDFYERIGEESFLEDGYDQLSKAVEETVTAYMEKPEVTAEDMNALRIYQNGIRLAGSMSKSQMFEVPVMLGDEVVNMKVQMVDTIEGRSNVSIHMENPNVGSFDVTATVQDNQLSAFIVCDNREVIEYYTNHKDTLSEALEQTGVKVKQLAVTMNRKMTEFYDTTGKGNNTSTEVLYQVAKVFVASTKKAFE